MIEESAPLPQDLKDRLLAIQAALGEALVIRSDQEGLPDVVAIRGHCPACRDEAWDVDLKTALEPGTSYLTLPDLTLRCRNTGCRAGAYHSGRDGDDQVRGLPYSEWSALLGDLKSPLSPSISDAGAAAGSIDPSRSTNAIVTAMEAHGSFLKLEHGPVFLRHAGGEPIRVGSKAFTAVVAEALRVSRRGGRLRGAVDALLEHAHLHGAPATLELLTARTASGRLLIHLGNGVVRQLTDGKLVPVPNGTEGVVFETEADFMPLVPRDLSAAVDAEQAHRFPALHRALLDDLPPSGGILDPKEMRALLIATILGPFVRPFATARPITLLLGPPGCGKTTTQRLVAVIFYGPEGEVAGGAALDRVGKDLLAGAVHQSLVVRDDVTDMPPGAIDTLCRMATGTKAKLAQFHETLAVVSYRARAQLLLSAVRPSWLSRPDLMSRLWIIDMAAGTTQMMTERERVERAAAARNAVFAEILLALRVLSEPLKSRVPISRFDSLEQVLWPILDRAGYGAAFESALRKMPEIAVASAAKADPLLGYLLTLAGAVAGKWLTAAKLASELARCLGVQPGEKGQHAASGLVRDPLRLGQFLAKLEREGSAVVAIESRLGHDKTRVWRLTPRFGGSGGVGGVDPGPTSLQYEKERESNGASSPANPVATPPTPPGPARPDRNGQGAVDGEAWEVGGGR